MRKKILIGTTIFLVSILTSCMQDDLPKVQKPKPVKIIEVKEETMPDTLQYIGLVKSQETRKIAFKSPGKLDKIYVEKGQNITKDTVIASLNTEDLKYALDAAKARMDATKAQYDKAVNGASDEDIKNAELNLKKAQDVYDFANTSFEDVQKLYNEGAVSKSEYDKTKLEFDIKESELNQAKQTVRQIKQGTRIEDKNTVYAEWQQAKTDYEYKKSMVDNAVLKSDIDGYIVDILYKEGEMVEAGYPVVIIRNQNQIVQIGITQKDMDKVKIGSQAEIDVDNKKTKGKVINIAQIPDSQIRTYDTEIVLDSSKYPIGAVAKVNIIVGEDVGIWIPISSIMSNGEDYVFIIENEKVIKKKINLEKIKGSKVKIQGLNHKDKLVTENVKILNIGDNVTIVE